jgi:predicted Zn-dependent protease with MMP-like domain
MPYSIKESDFMALARRELESLPDEFRRRMENVAVVVEDYPTLEDAESAGVPREELLGLFHGVSLLESEWFSGASGQLPEKIVLYKKNIEAACSTREELVEEIRLTLFHEIGHYFGMSEEDLEEYERRE